MTRLALDSSLPSGAFDILTNGPIAGTASHSAGFNIARPKPPMAPSGDAGSPCGNLASCILPSSSLAHDLATQSSPLNSPKSVNGSATSFLANQPTVHVAGGDGSTDTRGGCFHPNIASLSPPATWDIGAASLSRSVSADAVIPPPTSSRFYSAIGSHSSLMERNNLDALRRRAEQLYRDQQAVIDEMSDEWLKERAEMSQLIHFLRQRVQRLEGENTVLKSVASHNTRLPGLVTPQNSIQNGSLGGLCASKSPSPQILQEHNVSETLGALSLPPGLNGASRRPHFARQEASPRLSPGGAPAAGPAGSLSPRTEPQQSASTDFLLRSLAESTGDNAVIDVREIDPKLEGIPIRATAVQKPTFEPPTVQAVVRKSSTKAAQAAPPANGFHLAKRRGVWGAWEREKLRNDRRRSGLAPLTTTDVQVQPNHILAADESRRLTMHAGHTPNHSLSLFPTMAATESSSAAARSQETTPTAWPSSNHGGQQTDPDCHHVKVDRAQQSDNPEHDDLEKQMDGVVDVDVEGYLEPADDVPLKGQLMIKNIPAQDEIFWARVNQRLDPISRGKGALPKVLQSPELDATEPLHGTTSPPEDDEKMPEESNAGVTSDDETEPDIPLKFKASSNFGAPFGTAA